MKSESKESKLEHSPRSLMIASAIVAVFAIVTKTWAWYLTGSVGLLSDALESLVNLVAALFGLWMVIVAARPADESHPFGHSKAEYFSSAFEGILIFAAAVGIFWTAFPRLFNPEPLMRIGWGLLLSLASSVANAGLAIIMVRASRIRRSIALEADAKHLLADVWTSAGVVVGLLVVMLTHMLWLDAVVAIAVGVNIVREGGILIWRSAQGLMDVAMEDRARESIDQVLQRHSRSQAQQSGASSEGFDSAVSFDRVVTRSAGQQSFVDLHMHVPGNWLVQYAAQQRDAVERDLIDAVPGLIVRIELLPTGTDTASERIAGKKGFEHAISPVP